MLFCGACGCYAELACAGLGRPCKGAASGQRSKLRRLLRLEHPVKRGVFFETLARVLPPCAGLLDEPRGGARVQEPVARPAHGLDDPEGDAFEDLSD